jgi:hypothetical protein
MQQKRLYDNAIFWVAASAGSATLGGILVAASVPTLGWPLFVLGVAMYVRALQLYWHHNRASEKQGPRFEVVSTEWECEPDLNQSPIQDPRDCTAHVVLRNQGADGNGVLVVHYVGFGRAGDEYPEVERRTVIPATPAGAFVEVRCPVGSVPPLKLERHPKVEVMPAATGSSVKKEAPLSAPARSPTMIARPYGLGHPPDLTVEITQHEWTRTPVGRLILRTKVRIRNGNDGAVRSIRQHWLVCPGYPQANYGPLSLQTLGLSQMVGPVKPDETLEGHIYTELPYAGPTGPGAYDLYFEDDLGHVTKATKPGPASA